MTRRHVLLRETLARPLTPAEATAAGFILPTERCVEGLPVYATTALVEELQSACAEDWQAAARAATRNQAGPRPRRWRAQYRADDGRQTLPIAVTMQRPGLEDRGIILAMLDGE